MADERIRLLLDMGMSAQEAEKVVVGLDRLAASAKKTADTYEVLTTVVARSVGGAGEYDVMERRVTQAIVQQQTALDLLGIELNKQAGLYSVVTAEAAAMGGAMTRAMGTSGRGGMGIMGASYAFQDFTAVLTGGGGFARALSSVQNNIPILVTALGAGAGLAGTISIVAVGVGVLISSWDSLVNLWKGGDAAKQAEDMKKLAKATDDAREAAEKLAKTLPQRQREGSKELGRAVDAFGGEAVLKELREALVARGGSFGPEADKEMALRLFQNLQQGDRGAQRLLGDLDLRGPIGQVLRGGQTPAEGRAAAAAAAAANQKAEDAFRARQAAKDAAEKQKADELNRQGAANQKAAEDARAKDVARDVQLGRRIGQAAQQGRGAALPAGHIAPLPMMQADASEQEIRAVSIQTAQAIAANQLKLANDVQQMKEVYRTLRQVRTRLENNPMPAGNPR